MVDKSNTVTTAVLKEIGAAKGSGFPKLDRIGNLAVEQIIKIAKAKKDRLNAYELKNAVKTVAGACTSIGVLCESMHPSEFAKKVDAGAYDKEIGSESVSVSADKKAHLAKELAEINAKNAAELDELKKKVEAKAAKEAAMKAGGAAGAKAAPGAKPAPGAAPAAAAKPGAAPAAAAKPAAKPAEKKK